MFHWRKRLSAVPLAANRMRVLVCMWLSLSRRTLTAWTAGLALACVEACFLRTNVVWFVVHMSFAKLQRLWVVGLRGMENMRNPYSCVVGLRYLHLCVINRGESSLALRLPYASSGVPLRVYIPIRNARKPNCGCVRWPVGPRSLGPRSCLRCAVDYTCLYMYACRTGEIGKQNWHVSQQFAVSYS